MCFGMLCNSQKTTLKPHLKQNIMNKYIAYTHCQNNNYFDLVYC